MSDNLKPCPLCAAQVEIHLAEGIGYEILCEACDRVHVGYFDYEQDLISAWNTRPGEDALRARIAELEVELRNANLDYWNDVQ